MGAHAQTGTANNNVVVDGETDRLVLYADYPFAAPENFDANHTDIHRKVRSGYNTFYLPFFVNRDEIPSGNGKTYIYNSQDDTKVTFERKDGIDANVPFLMTNVTAADVLTFNYRKGVVATPTSNDASRFVGVYDGTISASGKWGIGDSDKFVQGGTNSTIKSFAAYITDAESSGSAKQIVLNDYETDGILLIETIVNTTNTTYTINGIKLNGQPTKAGVYIVNGKKTIIK